MNNDGDTELKFIFIFLILVVFGAVLVAAAPSFKADTYGDKTYYFLEDTVYTFNFSDNLTNPENMAYYQVLNITSTNHSDIGHSSYKWFAWNDTAFSDSPTGVMAINSTYDNQTGNFTLRIYFHDSTDNVGTGVGYNFMINATNDRPNFTVLDDVYNLSQSTEFFDYINVSDEEEMYPIWFNISWFSNCTHAAWSDRTNCSLFQPVNVSDNSASMNFTPENNDAGTYWANVTIVDFGENTGCPNNYCNNATYKVNKTWYKIVEFNVLSTLTINVTNCTGSVAAEGTTYSCSINISTVGEVDTVNISTQAWLTNYADTGIANKSWFYGNETIQASSNSKTINVSFTADKPEIGNWSINLTVDDLNDSVAPVIEQIYLNVTRSYNNVTQMSLIENITTSIDLETTIYFNGSDEDLLIPDKNIYNEVVSFTRSIINSTGGDADYLFGLSDGSVTGNRTTGSITFTPNSTDVGSYVVNISATDVGGDMNSTIFNITISDNNFPSWNQSSYTINLTVGATEATTTYFGVNLTNGYVSDTAGDSLTFSNTTNFSHFNLTTSGLLNITQWKQDVGTWQVNITATDELGLANTTTWTFNISNTNSVPNVSILNNTVTDTVITDGATVSWNEDVLLTLNLTITDNDFLITDDKKSIYNETHNLNVTFIDFSTSTAVSDLFTFVTQNISGDHEDYIAEYTPDSSSVGSFNVTLNVTDASGVSDYYSFNLTVTGQNDAPILSGIYNQTITNVTPNNIFYMDVNASDEEDGSESVGLLNFTIENLTIGGSFLEINETTGVINFTVNETSLGIWTFNVSVNDTSGGVNSEVFNVTIYGTPILVSPVSEFTFNLTENSASTLNFTFNHSVGYNLTYDFWIDAIDYWNSTDYNYTNLSLYQSNQSYGNGSSFIWSFTPNFTDETYGKIKNLTLVVYPAQSAVPNASNANTTVRFNLNISHTNSPIDFDESNPIGTPQTTTTNSYIELDLTQYFTDVDADDPYYNQTVNFTFQSNATPTYLTPSVDSNWTLTISSLIATSETLNITSTDYNISDNSLQDGNATSGNFQVIFTSPSTTTTQTSGGGGGSSVKHYSLKIITPQDVILTPEKNLIRVPFTVENNGQVDLKGINLTSLVRFNNEFSSDVSISLDEGYISDLKFGQSEDFTMTIRANTQRSGRYKATIFANVSTPKFSDWGDFFIDLRKTNESEAEQLLIFTEKFISENPECIELTELLKEAKTYLDEGDYSESYRLSQSAVEACEDAISSNEQRKFNVGEVRDSFYYISFATLVIFFVGLVFYVYKRVKFNKSKVDEYI